MPPARRRAISAATGTSIGTLLADESRQRQEADAATAKADNDKAKLTSSTAAQAKNIYNEYNSGDATYSDTTTALSGLSDGGNAELKQLLTSYSKNVENIRATREISDKVTGYNEGNVSYSSLKSYLQSYKSDNQVIKQNVVDSLDKARSTENTRAMNKSFQDYKAGTIDIRGYQNVLAQLRDTPGQTPSDLQTIGTAIENARNYETQMNDLKTYAGWQQGDVSASDALSYFNARSATSKLPDDVAKVTTYIGNIKNSADQSARGAASARATLVDNLAKKDMENYWNTIVTGQVGNGKSDFGTCNGDPLCIVDAYSSYGQRASDWAGQGGNNALEWQMESERAATQGLLLAANSMYNKTNTDVKSQIAAAKAMGNADPVQAAAAWQRVAETAANTESSEFLKQYAPNLVGPGNELNNARQTAAAEIQAVQQEMMTTRNTERNKTIGAQQKLLDSAKATWAAGALPSDPKLRAAIMTDDGQKIDDKKFMSWLQSDPVRNSQIIDDLSKGSQADAVKAILENANTTPSVTDSQLSKVTTSLYKTQYPSLSDAQLKTGVDQFMVSLEFGGAPFATGEGMRNANARDIRESNQLARAQDTFNQFGLGQNIIGDNSLTAGEVTAQGPGGDSSLAQGEAGGVQSADQQRRGRIASGEGSFVDYAGNPLDAVGKLLDPLRSRAYTAEELAKMSGKPTQTNHQSPDTQDLIAQQQSGPLTGRSGPMANAMNDVPQFDLRQFPSIDAPMSIPTFTAPDMPDMSSGPTLDQGNTDIPTFKQSTPDLPTGDNTLTQ
jgi:hypothetical protein